MGSRTPKLPMGGPWTPKSILWFMSEIGKVLQRHKQSDELSKPWLPKGNIQDEHHGFHRKLIN